MSYINEALKKAQKERDTRYIKYSGVLAGRREEKKVFGRKTFLGFLLPLLLIFFIVVSYSWLDFSVVEKTTNTEQKIPAQTEQHDDASNKNILYDKAKHLYKNGRLGEAQKFYEEILGLDPGHVDALNNVGVIYIHDKNYQAAERSFEKAIHLKPVYVEPYYNLACLHSVKGEVKQGLVYLKKAVSLDNTVKDWADNDPDLENLKALPEFKEIMAKYD